MTNDETGRKFRRFRHVLHLTSHFALGLAHNCNHFFRALRRQQILADFGIAQHAAEPGQNRQMLSHGRGDQQKEQPCWNIIEGSIRDPRGMAGKNNDGVIDDADRIILGNAQPKWVAGLSNLVSYKQFTLTFSFYVSWGGSIYNNARAQFRHVLTACALAQRPQKRLPRLRLFRQLRDLVDQFAQHCLSVSAAQIQVDRRRR